MCATFDKIKRCIYLKAQKVRDLPEIDANTHTTTGSENIH
jgi:hypothetical protein